ncbi:cutinase family protein [Microbacterium sp. MYb66]|uniref:cutinase family protein n=1 Tax=Microbacterium sp. MYb66 TaxID=1848692 RepID=UPI000D010D62|nr:cutinase family protein [Microbacterium sp. MYb66]PRA81349.1 hypothetical protein CQ045_08995 [Microbacterium sp. MYb66]
MIKLKSLSLGARDGARRRPKGDRHRVVLSAVGALTMLGSIMFGGASASAAASSSMCDFGVFVGVRGTGAPAGSNLVHDGRVWTTGGFGDQVAPIRTALANVPGMKFYFLSLAYPATGVLSPSIQDGKAKLISELNYITTTCPYAPIILAGHSQGAQVISQVLQDTVNFPSGAPVGLNPRTKANIQNVVLYGDPYYESGKATNYPNRPKNGLLSTVPYTKKNPLATYSYLGWPAGGSSQQTIYKVREYCNIGDFFCQSDPADSNYAIHNSYGQNANSVAGWIQYTLTSQD